MKNRRLTYGTSEAQHGRKVGIQNLSQEERVRKLYTRRGKVRYTHSPWRGGDCRQILKQDVRTVSSEK